MKNFLRVLAVSLSIALSAPLAATAAEVCVGPARAGPGCIAPRLSVPELAPGPETHPYAAREAAEKDLANFEGGHLGYVLVPAAVVVLAVVLILVLL